MPDPNLPLLEDAVHKLASFLDEFAFVGGPPNPFASCPQQWAPVPAAQKKRSAHTKLQEESSRLNA